MAVTHLTVCFGALLFYPQVQLHQHGGGNPIHQFMVGPAHLLNVHVLQQLLLAITQLELLNHLLAFGGDPRGQVRGKATAAMAEVAR